MLRRRKYEILSIVGVVFALVLATGRELLVHLLAENGEVKTWLEHQPLYSLRTLLLALAILLAATIAVRRWHKTTEASDKKAQGFSAPLNPALRLQLLDNVKKWRVDPILGQGLRKALRVDLGLTEIPHAVDPKLRVYATAEGDTLTERLIDRTIQDVFRSMAGGELLILGEPGTGKTNLLLELADILINEAKHNQAFPIPVVFNLPRWTLGKDNRTLVEWLKDDLTSEYGLSPKTADALIQQDSILPLLDALDEVSEYRRDACANAITEFQRNRDLGGLVVCCRTTEYAGLPRLELRTAVRVEKLTRADVEREISRPALKRARQTLESDPELWAMIDTPLWLHVLYAASNVAPSACGGSLDLHDRLYARYVKYVLDRGTDDSPRKWTEDEPLLRWLGWLAAEMQRRAQTQFAFENVDESWIPSQRLSWIVRWLNIALVGLAIDLSVGGRPGLVFGAYFLLLFGLEGFRGREVGELHFSWPDLRFGLINLPIWALVFGLIVWRSEAKEGLHGSALLMGVVLGLVPFLVLFWLMALLIGQREWPISQRSAPNRGTLRSFYHTCYIVLPSVPLALALLSLRRHLLPQSPEFDRLAMLPILLTFLAAFCLRGGDFVLRHYSIRFCLKCLGLAPLRYVRFLNEATERLFLVRHGGSYEFLHVTFRDYMVAAHGPNENVDTTRELKREIFTAL